jgi:hypothetical protein
MEMTLLRDDVLGGQIALTKSCVDAATEIVQYHGRLLQECSRIPRISVEDAGRVSLTILSTAIACSLSAAMLLVGSFDAFSKSNSTSKPSAPAPKSNPKGPRRTKAIVVA